MTPITLAEIERIERYAKLATPGPWHALLHDGCMIVGTSANNDGTYYAVAERIGGRRKGEGFKDRSEEINNHQLIAELSPEMVLRLLDAARRGLTSEQGSSAMEPKE